MFIPHYFSRELEEVCKTASEKGKNKWLRNEGKIPSEWKIQVGTKLKQRYVNYRALRNS